MPNKLQRINEITLYFTLIKVKHHIVTITDIYKYVTHFQWLLEDFALK